MIWQEQRLRDALKRACDPRLFTTNAIPITLDQLQSVFDELDRTRAALKCHLTDNGVLLSCIDYAKLRLKEGVDIKKTGYEFCAACKILEEGT